MNKKQSYTLKDAKNDVAKRHGYDKWFDIDFYQIDSSKTTTKPPYSEEALRDEAAELYKDRVTEELRKKNKSLKRKRLNLLDIIRFQRKRSVELTQLNKELNDSIASLKKSLNRARRVKE